MRLLKHLEPTAIFYFVANKFYIYQAFHMNPWVDIATRQCTSYGHSCDCSLCGITFTDPSVLDMHLEQKHRGNHSPNGEVRNQFRETNALLNSDSILNLKMRYKDISTCNRNSPVLDTYYFDEITSNPRFYSKNFTSDYVGREEAISDTLSRPTSNSISTRDSKDLSTIEYNTFYNTTKETWDCGICRKSFKEKNDLYQHLRSATHETRRFSCSDCGKAFSSVGAITQHIEQSGHSSDNKMLAHDLAQVTATTNGHHIPNAFEKKLNFEDRDFDLPRGVIFSRESNLNPATSFNRRTASFPAMKSRSINTTNIISSVATKTAVPYKNMSQYSAKPFGNFVNGIRFTGKERGECSLYFGGAVIPRSLSGSCGWAIMDNSKDEIVCEGTRSVDLIYPGSLRAEYEGLLAGLTEAVNRRISLLQVVTDNELVFLHLKNGSGLLSCQSVYRIADDIARQVRAFCHNFTQIRFRLVPVSDNNRVRQLANNHLQSLQAK